MTTLKLQQRKSDEKSKCKKVKTTRRQRSKLNQPRVNKTAANSNTRMKFSEEANKMLQENKSHQLKVKRDPGR